MRISEQKIKLLMANKGLRQKDLAKSCAYSNQFISTVLGRQSCHPKTAKRIADVLGVDVCEITPNGSERFEMNDTEKLIERFEQCIGHGDCMVCRKEYVDALKQITGVTKTKNLEIREYAKTKKVKLWQVADKLGIHQSHLSCLLRYELSDDEKRNFIQIINEIAKENE